MSSTTTRFSRITGTGSYLPPNRVSNEALAAQLARDGVETSDEWIVERTGIRARHFAAPDVASSDLAVQAARHALEAAGRKPEEIDLIIVATSMPSIMGMTISSKTTANDSRKTKRKASAPEDAVTIR